MFTSLQVYCIVIQAHRPKIHKYMIRKIQNVKNVHCRIRVNKHMLREKIQHKHNILIENTMTFY